MNPTTGTLTALTALVDETRRLAASAIKRKNPHMGARLTDLARQLDACRTRLVQDGDEYLPTAWAWLDTARPMVATWRAVFA